MATNGNGQRQRRPASTAAPIRSRITPTMSWWSAPAARACARSSAAPKPACAPPASPRCSRRARTPSRRRAASRRRSATWARTTGAGTCTTPSRASDWLGDQDAIEYMVPQRAGGRLRTRALGPAVLAPRGRRQDLSAPVRRHDHALRQGHGATHLRGRRPHRPRHAAHDVRAGAAPSRRNSSSSISPST